MAVVHFHHRSQARGTVVMAEHCLSRLHHFQISKLRSTVEWIYTYFSYFLTYLTSWLNFRNIFIYALRWLNFDGYNFLCVIYIAMFSLCVSPEILGTEIYFPYLSMNKIEYMYLASVQTTTESKGFIQGKKLLWIFI
jgi:hypothetical protein